MRLLRNCTRVATVAVLVALGLIPAGTEESIDSVYSPLSCPGVSKVNDHVSLHSDGSLWYRGARVKFTGYTFYPADIGGTPVWSQIPFASYIDTALANEAYLGANLVRPTDQFASHITGQTFDDPALWSNMDHLVCQAARRGTFIELDLSFLGHLLVSQGKNAMDAGNWLPMIETVAKHYAGWQSIAWVTFFGEPPYPTTLDQVNALRRFYATVLATYHRYDPTHLLAPGGLTHTMYGYPDWWQAIASVPHASIFAYKVYDRNDETYLPTIYDWTAAHGQALINEEFGVPQSQGDGTWSGRTFNGLNTDRARFFAWNYLQQRMGRTQASIFWNDSCLVGPSNYDVNPTGSPATIAVIRANAAVRPTASTWSGWSC